MVFFFFFSSNLDICRPDVAMRVGEMLRNDPDTIQSAIFFFLLLSIFLGYLPSPHTHVIVCLPVFILFRVALLRLVGW